MIQSRFEFLFMILIFSLISVSLLWTTLESLAKSRVFWVSLVLFVVYSLLIESLGLWQNWWGFSSNKVVGIMILKMPLEELFIYIIFGGTTIGVWEFFSDDN